MRQAKPWTLGDKMTDQTVLVERLLDAADEVLSVATDTGADTDEETGDSHKDFAALQAAYTALRPEADEYPREPMVTMACLWEYVIENRRNCQRPWVHQACDAHGTVAIRYDVVGLVEPCEEAWQILAKAGFDDSYDWDHCPWFMEACVDWSWGHPDVAVAWRETVELRAKEIRQLRIGVGAGAESI